MLNYMKVDVSATSGVSRRDLVEVFRRADDLLRCEGLRDGIERFAEFSNLLFLKIASEMENDQKCSDAPMTLERNYCWDAFSGLPARDMLDYINDVVLRRLRDAYNHSGDVFPRRLLIKSPQTLKMIVGDLSRVRLIDADSDVKGDAFEYFLKHSTAVGNDLGEFFTPRHIVRLMVDMVDPRADETIYDPCCGTGGFLIYALEHARLRAAREGLKSDDLSGDSVFGRELTGTARVAKMNMILAGGRHTNIDQMDSLSEPVDEAHDVVLTNYPFSQQTQFAGRYGCMGNDANPVFLVHAIRALKPGGRAAIIVPDGFLFDESVQYVKTRRSLLEECDVQAVVHLPRFAFRPFTSQPTSIIVFRKGAPTGNVWFFTVEQDGFSNTTSKYGRAPIPENDLTLAREAWADGRASTDLSFQLSAAEIAENNYKLMANGYRRQTPPAANWVPLGGEAGLCDIIIGKTPPTRDPSCWNGEHPWATIADLTDKIVTATSRSITDQGRSHIGSDPLPEGTLLFSFKLSIGKTALTGCELHTNEAIAALIPRDDRVLPEYLYYILPHLDYSRYQQPTTKGPTLNKRSLSHVLVPAPPKSEQLTMLDALRKHDHAIQQHLEAIRKNETDARTIVSAAFQT